MTFVFVEAKTCCKTSDAWDGTLSWSWVQDCCTTSLEVCAGLFDFSRLRTSQQNFTFSVCPGGTNSLRAMLSVSNFCYIFGRDSVRSSSRTLFIIDWYPSLHETLKPLVILRLAYDIISKCFFKHSVCFRKSLSEFEAEFDANPFLLHISYFRLWVRLQNSTKVKSQKCTEKNVQVITAVRRLAEWFVKGRHCDTYRGAQMSYERFSHGIAISGTFG